MSVMGGNANLTANSSGIIDIAGDANVIANAISMGVLRKKASTP